MAGVDPDLKSGDPVVNPALAGPTELHSKENSYTLAEFLSSASIWIIEADSTRALILLLLFHPLISRSLIMASDRVAKFDS
jgi:hypothetical protein